MDENEYLFKIITSLLEKGSSLILASIVNQQGSAPRHNGTKMVIDVNGNIYGTIGGSLLEAITIKESRLAISGHYSRLMEFDLSGKDANAKGMICGGKAQILLAHIIATNENLFFFRLMRETIQKGQNFYFLTHFKETDESVDILGYTILYQDGRVAGGKSIEDNDAELLKMALHNLSSTAVIQLNDNSVVIDPIRKIKTLFCCGAGHVAEPTAHIAALVGFRVIVIDDRAEYATQERFPEAYRVCLVKEFNRALVGMDIDSDSFIVIVTRGHQFDREVLEQSLKTPASYIGMISSRRKKAAIYEALLAKGVARTELDRVHSPIGLDIGGETPEEIAVSIVAELIGVRARQQR